MSRALILRVNYLIGLRHRLSDFVELERQVWFTLKFRWCSSRVQKFPAGFISPLSFPMPLHFPCLSISLSLVHSGVIAPAFSMLCLWCVKDVSHSDFQRLPSFQLCNFIPMNSSFHDGYVWYHLSLHFLIPCISFPTFHLKISLSDLRFSEFIFFKISLYVRVPLTIRLHMAIFLLFHKYFLILLSMYSSNAPRALFLCFSASPWSEELSLRSPPHWRHSPFQGPPSREELIWSSAPSQHLDHIFHFLS